MKKSPKPGDMNQRMYAVVQQAAGLSDEPQAPEKDPAAVERGRLGGKARAARLSHETMSQIGRDARAARSLKAATLPMRPRKRSAKPDGGSDGAR